MIKKTLGLILLCISPIFLLAQFKNNQWLVGEYNQFPTPAGGSKLVVYNDSIDVSFEERSAYIEGCFSGLSAIDNSWFVYTNGSVVCNKFNDTLTNGYGLSPGASTNYWHAMPHFGMALILPAQSSGSLLYEFHENVSIAGVQPFFNVPRTLQLYYSIIDATAGNKGTVYLKNQLLIDDTLELGNLNVCRHANGRDWWILVKRFNSSKYYTILTNPNGPIISEQMVSGDITIVGGQGQFSPDGNYYATFGAYSQLRVYDFDRCTGLLSNYRNKFITNGNAGALSISPNSRYIYVSKNDTLWQFDMQAPDQMNSQSFIAEYDGFIDTLTGYNNKFMFHWLGPDGKIYLSSIGSQSRFLHTINNPDEPGTACNFQQHNIEFPTYNNKTTPTYVNLNLFQVPNSACDSLEVGIQKLNVDNSALKILPNPSDGQFSVEYTPQRMSGMLYLYNVSGKEVYKEYVSPYSSIKNLDLTQKLNNGIYAVCLVFGNSTLTQKVVIEKP